MENYTFRTFSRRLKVNRSTPFKISIHFITVICVTLCLYQVVQLLNQYFEYAVEYQTTIGNIDTMTLPTVSVCSSYEIYGDDEPVTEEIRYLFQEIAYDYDHRILDCTLVLRNGSKINCHSITKPEKYISYE